MRRDENEPSVEPARPDPDASPRPAAVAGAPDDATAGSSAAAPPAGGAGLRAIAAEEFSLRDVIGGWRGLVESIAPGLVFVVVYVATRSMPAALISSLATAAIAVIVRLIGRSTPMQAVSGLGGVVIGVVWAWLSGRAENYFAGGFIVNLVILAVALGSILARWPAVGVLYGLLTGRSGWRDDPQLRRRATWATWPWVVLPIARIAVQWPIYLEGADAVGWLGSARLAMGLPLTALAVYVSWLAMRSPRAAAAGPAPTPPPR